MCLPFILTLPGSPFSPFSPCCPAEPGVPLSLIKKRVVSYLQHRIEVGIKGKIRYLSLAWYPQKRPIKVTKKLHLCLLMIKKRSVNGTWPFQPDSATCTDTQLKEIVMLEALGPWLNRCGAANVRISRDKWLIYSSHCRLLPTIHWGRESLEGSDCWMRLSSLQGTQQEVSDAFFSEWKPTKPPIKKIHLPLVRYMVFLSEY